MTYPPIPEGRLPFWWRMYRRDQKLPGHELPLWHYLPGVRTWDDPVWSWAVEIPLPFGLTIRFGKSDR